MLIQQESRPKQTSNLEQVQKQTKAPCSFCLQTRMQFMAMLQQGRTSVNSLLQKVMDQANSPRR